MLPLARYTDIAEAELAKAYLESHGILVEMFDRHTMSINPFASYAYGGIRLMVAEEDLAKARQLLEEAEREAPKTQTAEMKPSVWAKIFLCLGAILTLGVPIIFRKRKPTKLSRISSEPQNPPDA